MVIGQPELPGEVLRKKFLEPNDISQRQFAKYTGWTYKHVNEICTGKVRVTIATAYILGKVLSTGADYWLDLQRNVDQWNMINNDKEIWQRVQSLQPLVVA